MPEGPIVPTSPAAPADQANRVHVAPGEASKSGATKPPPETVKDTIISIVIAFALAFVFRGFVVEAFVIPTGSMAPTLMGAHMRFRSPASGYTWPVGPWYSNSAAGDDYAPLQGTGTQESVTVHDPISGELVDQRNVPLRSGDRILVLKYLFSLMPPARYDVIVFKNPTNPSQNYIKRLIGLPGEEIALVDGDVFTRALADTRPDAAVGAGGTWELPGWRIARKDLLEQRSLWQTVFDSSFAPTDGSFTSPWNTADLTAWSLEGQRYTLDPSAVRNASGRTELFFDQSRPRFAAMPYRNLNRGENWSLDDRYPYDETPVPQVVGAMGSRLSPASFQLVPRFPVADLRMRAGIQPAEADLVVEANVRARGHDFQALIECGDSRSHVGTVTLRMRPLVGEIGVAGAWQQLASRRIDWIPPGRVTDVEFCHTDQSLQLWIGGELVLRHDYDWSPAERIFQATGRHLDQIMSDPRSDKSNPLADPALYRKPDVRWAFSGGAGKSVGVTLYRVGLDRDIHYQPAIDPHRGGGSAGMATAPSSPMILGSEQFFACGDNSPQSLDGRLWGDPDGWVALELDRSPGVVPRELLLGKAFFVYWPSLIKTGRGVPAPDFGRMRFIW